MKTVNYHLRTGHRQYEPITVNLEPGDGANYWTVYKDGIKLDTLVRDPNHRTHQVHNRLRYDNKRRTAWFLMGSGLGSFETRKAAIAWKLRVHEFDLHVPGRNSTWSDRCDLCGETDE